MARWRDMTRRSTSDADPPTPLTQCQVSGAPDPARYARRGVVHHLPKPLDLHRVHERLRAICAAA